jgi:hypothetical protein
MSVSPSESLVADPTVKISVSMPAELRSALEKRAKQQRRSLSGHLQFLVEKDLKGSGIELKAQPSTAEVGA